jgi:low affinity Fe/Cu permease
MEAVPPGGSTYQIILIKNDMMRIDYLQVQEAEMNSNKAKSGFTRFAKWTAYITGRPIAFILAVVVILVWALTGPFFDFSDTWQLVINTGTTIMTFLMVFLIQNTQYRDSEAIHIKLDELIRSIKEARKSLLDLEEMEDDELDRLRADYEKLAERARSKLQERQGAKRARQKK